MNHNAFCGSNLNALMLLPCGLFLIAFCNHAHAERHVPIRVYVDDDLVVHPDAIPT
jgi:hypothetical protein